VPPDNSGDNIIVHDFQDAGFRPLAGIVLLYGINTGNALPCYCAVPSYFPKRRVRRNYLGRVAKMLHPVARSRLVPSRPAGRLFTCLNGEEQFANFRYQFNQAPAACWLSGS